MRSTILAGAAALALIVAGCGSSNDNNSSGGSKKSSSASSSKMQASSGAGGAGLSEVASDFKFSKPKATAKAGAVTVNLSNNGGTAHAIEVEGKGIEKKSSVIQAGQTTTLKVNLKPGKYEFYCPVDGHKKLGMKGTLTVR